MSNSEKLMKIESSEQYVKLMQEIDPNFQPFVMPPAKKHPHLNFLDPVKGSVGNHPPKENKPAPAKVA